MPTAFTLDARQRAMLKEMGITVWAPLPTPAQLGASAPPPAPAPGPIHPIQTRQPPQQPTHQPVSQPISQPRPPQHTSPALPARPAAPRPSGDEHAIRLAPGSTHGNAPGSAPAAQPMAPANALLLYPTVPLFARPHSDDHPAPPHNPTAPRWLVLWETSNPEHPLQAAPGQLLENMLRALKLHHHPPVYLAPLVPARMAPPLNTASPSLDHGAPGTQASQPPQANEHSLSALLAQLRPTLVLALGWRCARTLLHSNQPLDQLRQQHHQLPDGTPVCVTHDPNHLLRTPQAKAAAWVDLCRALALTQTRANPAV